MTDWDHYKKAYSGEWDAGNRRERLVAEIIEQLGLTVEMEGLGAGSTEFISGRAEEHGKDKADPDLFIPKTETYIEVTGTNIGWVRPEKPIRIRPDKFENALKNPEEDHWVVHILDGPAFLRCVELTEGLCSKFQDQKKSIDTRHDTDETYVEIDPDHSCIQSFTALLSHLVPEKEDKFETAIQTALTRWTTVDDIEDGVRYSVALKLYNEDIWENHDSINRRLQLEDYTDDNVTMTIFEDSDFTSKNWEEGAWYFFYDLKGEIYQGDSYLLPTPDSDLEKLSDRQAPT